MKKSSIVKLGILGIFLTVGFSGCNQDNSIPSNSSTDKLTLIQSGNSFTIDWQKRTSGYSKVTYNYKKIIAHNFTGLYSLTCNPSRSTSSSVSYSCIGEGPSILGGKDKITASLQFNKNEQYKFRVTYGISSSSSDGEIDAVLEYSANTLSIH